MIVSQTVYMNMEYPFFQIPKLCKILKALVAPQFIMQVESLFLAVFLPGEGLDTGLLLVNLYLVNFNQAQ